jgi:hypothetical protein
MKFPNRTTNLPRPVDFAAPVRQIAIGLRKGAAENTVQNALNIFSGGFHAIIANRLPLEALSPIKSVLVLRCGYDAVFDSCSSRWRQRG